MLLLLLCSCKNKPAPTIDNFADYYTIDARYFKERAILRVAVSLKSPVHAYAPKELTGKPVRLEVKPQNGWEPLGDATYPSGKKESSKGQDSYVLDKDFSIEQRLKPGRGVGRAVLHLQVCTNTQCDRPRSHELSFE